MLLNDFFWIKSCNHDQEKQSIKAEIEININHPIYAGHFPGTPVTPGVCLMQIVSDILCHVHRKEYQLVSSSTIKFINMLIPTDFQMVDVTIDYSEENHNVHINGLISKGETVFFKIKGNYKVKELN